MQESSSTSTESPPGEPSLHAAIPAAEGRRREPEAAFRDSAPAADITVERYLYRNTPEGVEPNAVLREPDGSLRISTGGGHHFLDPQLARWLEQDNTVLAWQQVPAIGGGSLVLCLLDGAGNRLWHENLPIVISTPPPAVPHDYGGPAMGLGSRLRLQSLTSTSGSHTLLHHDNGDVVLYCNATHTPVWSTETSWVGDSWVDLTLRGDLVLRTSCGAPVWRSRTADMGVEQLTVRDDGSLALLDAAGVVVWQVHHHAPCTVAGHAPPRGAVLRRGQILRNQSLTSADGGTVLYHRAGEENGAGTRLFRGDGIQLWSAPESRAAEVGLALDSAGFLQVRADDGRVLEQIAGPGDYLIVAPGGEIRLCVDDGTVVWRAGQHVLSHDDEIVTASPRPVTPAAVAALLNAERTPIVRTDFSDDDAWETAWRDITLPRRYWDSECVLDATLVAIPEFEGWTSADFAALLSRSDCGDLLIVDTVTLASAEHPVLIVEIDPEYEQPRSFRAIPHALLDVEIQLSLANMDWEDFADSVDSDGVLRTSSAD